MRLEVLPKVLLMIFWLCCPKNEHVGPPSRVILPGSI